MANQTGIAIVIKAFLPTGKSLDDQFNALTIVKNAHASGDYAELLKAASVEEVKTEQKTRRVEDAAPTPSAPAENSSGGETTTQEAPPATEAPAGVQSEDAAEGDVPGFLKKGRQRAA